MLILSLDTSTRAGSAAVLDGLTVLHEMAGDPATPHGQRLPTDLMRLLSGVALGVRDVDAFAVAAGPGSFTGLRVGIATMQGLAMANGRQITPVATLEALARSAASGARRIAAWMDAQRGEVFASLYAPDGRSILSGPTSAPPTTTLSAWRETLDLSDLVFVGDGALRYRDVIEAELPDATVRPAPLLAAVIGRIAAAEPSRAVRPHAVVPIYVRRSDAEMARDRGRR